MLNPFSRVDWMAHLKFGVLAMLFALAFVLLVQYVHLDPRAAICAAVGLTFAITKEAADKLDNKLIPGMHSVEFMDGLFGALPCLLAAGYFQWVAA